MKSILMSIRPEWCEKIFYGEKTIEVRWNRPKLEPQFTVYVYCTKAKNIREDGLYLLPNDKELYLGCKEKDLGFVCWEGDFRNGKVIGSFICDRIDEIEPDLEYYSDGYDIDDDRLAETCLTREQLREYGKGVTLYGWHITEPHLFEKPRDITEFAVFGKCADECSEYDFCARDIAEDRVACKCFKRTFLKRPPRLWCYVEGE